MINPTVSIVLPSYNGEKYIEESIKSVIDQSFTDWELIIVDDNSNDNTGLIADNYTKIDNRISVIHNDNNEKLPEALNIGFRNARGKYYTWTSDDNKYLCNALEEMVEYLENNIHIDMVCTNMLIFDNNWKFIRENVQYDDQKMYLEDTVGASFMYRKEIVDRIGEYKREFFCVEDYEYWVRILESGLKIGYLKGAYYLYRVHNESLTISKRETVQKQQRLMYLKHIDWILNGISKDMNSILYLYGELLKAEDIDFNWLNSRFKKIMPVIEYDKKLPQDKDVYIYGAGEYGRRVIEKIGKNRITAVVDRNCELQGRDICGIPIISPDELIKKSVFDKKINVVIGVSEEKQFDIISWLVEHKIESYTLYAHIETI